MVNYWSARNAAASTPCSDCFSAPPFVPGTEGQDRQKVPEFLVGASLDLKGTTALDGISIAVFLSYETLGTLLNSHSMHCGTALALQRAMASILLVDDDLSIRTVVTLMLARTGHTVAVACSGEEALVLAATNPPDLVLSDLCMSGMNGDELLQEISRKHPATGCILMTGDSDHASEQAARPCLFLRKPFSCQALTDAVDAALGVLK